MLYSLGVSAVLRTAPSSLLYDITNVVALQLLKRNGNLKCLSTTDFHSRWHCRKELTRYSVGK